MPAYQPDDVNDILRRASELQARTQGTPDVGGLTPEDLQTLGAEIGIDPRFVAEALRQRAGGGAAPVAPGGGFFGGPARVRAERTLPAPLTDDLWNAMADEMRAVTGEPGDTSVAGSERTWGHRLMGGTTRAFLRAVPTREGTRVSVERYTANHGASIFVVSLSLVLLATLFAAMGAGLTGLGAGVLALVLTFVASRFAYGRRVRSVARETEQMLDRLDLVALRESMGAATSTARIALPTSDAPDAVTDVRGGTRTAA